MSRGCPWKVGARSFASPWQGGACAVSVPHRGRVETVSAGARARCSSQPSGSIDVPEKWVRYALFQGDFMTSIGRPTALCGALLFAWAASCLAATRPITENDLLRFRWVADPQISPDGRQVAYVLVEVNEKEDRYDTSLWAVAASESSEPRRLTAGPR